jgi:hypothetical protein
MLSQLGCDGLERGLSSDWPTVLYRLGIVIERLLWGLLLGAVISLLLCVSVPGLSIANDHKLTWLISLHSSGASSSKLRCWPLPEALAKRLPCFFQHLVSVGVLDLQPHYFNPCLHGHT